MSNTESVVEITITTGDAPPPSRVFMGIKVVKTGIMICFTDHAIDYYSLSIHFTGNATRSHT